MRFHERNFPRFCYLNFIKFTFSMACCSNREDLFHWCINCQCATDIDEAMVISFLGVRTDRHGFGILTWKHVSTQKISTHVTKYAHVTAVTTHSKRLTFFQCGRWKKAYAMASESPRLRMCSGGKMRGFVSSRY